MKAKAVQQRSRRIHVPRRLSFWFIGATLLGTPAAVGSEPSASAARRLAEANDRFAIELYDRVRTREGNLFFSPYSIATVLRMVGAGARGETATQLAALLQTPMDDPELHAASGEMLHQVLKPTNGAVELRVANGLWAQQGHKFREDFLGLLQHDYLARVQPVDFAHAAQEAAAAINRWVADQTRGRIDRIVEASEFSRDTELVLANAVFFQADWEQKFNEERTTDAPFHVDRDRQHPVKMMRQTATLPFAEFPSVSVLELAYAGREFRMLIALPKAIDGLPSVERLLVQGHLARWLPALKNADVNVALPRFKLTGEIDLAHVLPNMGATDLFDVDKANLAGMGSIHPLFVEAARHRAWVEVNENGTVAAAATHLMMSRGAPRIEQFVADHPFLFLIFHRSTGQIVFLGHVADPE